LFVASSVSGMVHEHRADHLSPDERRHAGRAPLGQAAELAGEQRLLTFGPLVRLAEPHREARIRLGGLELLGER
jgi:hypothetical protein